MKYLIVDGPVTIKNQDFTTTDERLRCFPNYSDDPAFKEWSRKYVNGICPKCRKKRTPEGHDPCIANLPGVLNACCGHGMVLGYVQFENGAVIRGFFDCKED